MLPRITRQFNLLVQQKPKTNFSSKLDITLEECGTKQKNKYQMLITGRSLNNVTCFLLKYLPKLSYMFQPYMSRMQLSCYLP